MLIAEWLPLLHDFNRALRRSITHIASLFLSPSPLVTYWIIHCWQKHVWVSLVSNELSPSALATMDATAYLAEQTEQWLMILRSLFIRQSKPGRKQVWWPIYDSMGKKSVRFGGEKTSCAAPWAENGWPSEIEKKAAVVNTSSSASAWKYSIHCPKGNWGWAEEKFWLVIKCQWKSAKAVDELCKHQFKCCGETHIGYTPCFAYG